MKWVVASAISNYKVIQVGSEVVENDSIMPLIICAEQKHICMSLWMRIFFYRPHFSTRLIFPALLLRHQKRESPSCCFSAYNYEQCTKRLQSAIETITVTYARLGANSAEITSFRAAVKRRHPVFAVHIPSRMNVLSCNCHAGRRVNDANRSRTRAWPLPPFLFAWFIFKIESSSTLFSMSR